MESCCLLEVEDPFQSAIERFRQIRTASLPSHKLQTIWEAHELISSCLQASENFRRVVIDADTLLLVWLYVIYRARVKNLHAHLRLVEEFSGEAELY